MVMTELNEDVMGNQLIQELTSLISDTNVKIPYIEKDKVLMSPGIWNNKMYTAEEIIKAFNNTDWENKQNKFLFYDHEDLKASEWIGEIENQKCSNEGIVTGDLKIVDPILAIKLAYGKPKIGISPKVRGQDKNNEMQDFVYENFSVVVVPAVKTAWINNSEGSKSIEIDSIKNEVKQMTDEHTEVKNNENEVQLSEELKSFIEFYNSEITKNPSATLKDVCNAFVIGDMLKDEPKKEDEEKPIDEENKEEDEEEKKPETTEEQSQETKVAVPEKNELSEQSSKTEELEKIVQTMSEQIKVLTEKLEATPDRVATKLSEAKTVSQELSNKVDSDTAMMAYLRDFK